MIAILIGMGGSLCLLLLALTLSKAKRALGDVWIAAWFALYLIYFACMGAAQLLDAPTLLLPLALIGQCAATLLAPAQFLHTWSATAAPMREGLARAAWALVLIGALIALALSMPLSVRSGAIVADVSPWLLAAPLMAMLATAAYPIMALRRLHAHRAQLKQRLSNLQNTGLAWTRTWALSTIALLIAQALTYVVSLSGAMSVPLHVAVLICAQTAQIAYVGWRGLAHGGIFRVDPGEDASAAPGQADLAAARADFATLQAFAAEHQPHTEPDLSAQALADQLGWAPFRLTQALRLGGASNFHDFVNLARVETVKRLMLDAKLARRGLLSLALDAGFGSKSAFYEAFRAAEGMTPARWRAERAQA